MLVSLFQDAHSQGEVVSCLEKGLVKEAEEGDPKIQVSEVCKKAILRVAELSSDDFHLDRHLYFACRDDRERFCENVSQLRNSCFLPFLFKYFKILYSRKQTKT